MLRQACEAQAILHPASAVGPVVTISLGVACSAPTDVDITKTIHRADQALYQAKKQNELRWKMFIGIR